MPLVHENGKPCMDFNLAAATTHENQRAEMTVSAPTDVVVIQLWASRGISAQNTSTGLFQHNVQTCSE